MPNISPVFAYGVSPSPGRTRATTVPIRNRPREAVSSPLASITALIPALAALTIGRRNSTDRIRAIARCWRGATVSPNQASLVTLTSHPAPPRTLSRMIPGNTAS